MPLYETVIIARQDISSQQVETLTEAASAFITNGGGNVAKVEQWGLRNLAYKIKKNRKGHYVLLNIDAPADAMKEMERNLRLNEDVLRHMTIKVDELEEGDSVMLQSRSSRPERRRDRDDDDGDSDNRSSSNRDDDTADDSKEKEDA
ncbi:30S ribosomal protein S6 [uncultured Sneathiella sp.]|jgi:small subunit ribosomal protein S6|uniref:30S ribosomal protein S6 n=1 Tax=uncultured Sneathiella sp. TaxID=879315 RepID=UPI0030DD3F26|tara:strand:- start:427 stop:867 length:441 start_codon:yes stop_codon:yes gene_type:complete